MKTVRNSGVRIKRKTALIERLQQEDPKLMATIAMIQTLIPLGLGAVGQILKREVVSLAGPRYSRGSDIGRHGSNPGSVYLYDQKVAVEVPRLRHKRTDAEVPLATYAALQQPATIDALTLSRMIHGISTGHYEEAALTIPETLGLKRNAVSRRWIRSSAKKLAALEHRDLSGYDIVAIFIDGKAFSREKEMVIAVGVTLQGEKVILGFVETSTENHRVLRQFLEQLQKRGLCVDEEILFVIDGSPGIRKGIDEVFPETAFVQRCTWHKREDILSYLSEADKAHYRPLLQDAYEQPSYTKAKARLQELRQELVRINLSAAHSLDEGFEETLTLQRLGIFEALGTSLKTTNVIENVNKLVGTKTDRVCYWKTSDQRQRWIATALLTVEPQLRKIRGYRYLPLLRAAMRRANEKRNEATALKAA